MRRTVTQRLLQGQDICLFCAFRHGLRQSNTSSLRPQRRSYNVATSLKRPAGAAAARVEEDDDLSAFPTRELLGWKCRCSHVNKPSRTECTLCLTSRPSNAQMVYKDLNPPPPPPPTIQPPLPTPPPPPTMKPSRPVSWMTRPSPDTGRTPRFAAGSTSISDMLSRPRLGLEDVKTRPQQRSTPGNRQREPHESGFSNPRIRTESVPNEWSSRSPPRADRTEITTHHNEYKPRDRPLVRFQTPAGWRNTMAAEEQAGYSDQRARQNDYVWGSSIATRVTGQYRQENDRGQSSRYDASLQRQAGVPSQRFAQPAPQQNWSRNEPAAAEESSAPQAWKPMSRGVPRPPPQQDPLRSGIERGTNNDYRTRRPRTDSGQGLSRSADYRRERNPSVRPPSGDMESAVSVDESIDVLNDEPFMQETEDERRRRKDLAAKDRDRRARLWDVEEEEGMPLEAPRTQAQAQTRRVTGSRGGTTDFHYDPDLAEEMFDDRTRKTRNKKAQAETQAEAEPQRREIILPEFISVEKLAQGLKVRLPQLLRKLEEEGFQDARYDHILDSSTSAMFAEIYGFEPIIETIDDSADIFPQPSAEDPSILPTRPPIVTIMGHVDHGKTTILDYFRKANVVASEHGGITQHIGAFSVTMPGSERNITFLDTPGHAAFLEMRRRGAVVTDIVVLVVAADDSVKAQTIEAIKHAQEAGVQIIVAINKIDKAGADVGQVQRDLMQHDILVEDMGGEYQAIPVSGKTGRGMNDLEEAILTLADVADFRAEVDGPAEGSIIESRVGVSGRVATVLVRRGTLRPGDFIVAGTTWARVRTLRNDAGELIKEAPPGTPVQIDGWRGEDPEAGLEVLQAENEQRAKDAIAVRKEKAAATWEMDNTSAINASRTEDAAARAKVLEWEKEQGYTSMNYKRRPKDNEGWVEKDAVGAQLVHFVVKADVAGSTEALVAAVSEIGNNEARANIVHNGTGGLTESDIKMLAATGEVAYAITFNQPVENDIRQLAAAARIQILDHNIIYKVTDDVRDKVSAELPPVVTQRVLGEAEIGEIFEIKSKKTSVKIAGCRVSNGTVRRSEKIRVLRRGKVVYTGTLNSFKNVKKDVTEMRKGSECGMGFENWDEFEVGDQIQSFEEKSEKRTLH